MVKHTQTIRRQFSEELFECVWPFCGVGAQRVKIISWWDAVSKTCHQNNVWHTRDFYIKKGNDILLWTKQHVNTLKTYIKNGKGTPKNSIQKEKTTHFFCLLQNTRISNQKSFTNYRLCYFNTFQMIKSIVKLINWKMVNITACLFSYFK